MRSETVLAADAAAPSWAVWVTTAGVILAAAATAAAAAYAARRKVREVELSYAQRLQDSYLSNAREYLQSVYLPLHLAVTALVRAHRDFRAVVDHEAEAAPDDAVAAFKTAIGHYDTRVTALLDRAAGAFLTTILEEQLENFTHFVRASQFATQTEVRLVVSLSAWGNRVDRDIAIPRRLPFSSMNLRYLMVRFTADQQRTVAAPLPSREFDHAFTEQVTVLRALVKEVTLGAHARSERRNGARQVPHD